jgi:hypothetical protein
VRAVINPGCLFLIVHNFTTSFDMIIPSAHWQQRKRSQQEQESRRREQDEEKRQKAIAALTPHHIAALRAVSTSHGFEQIETFTFDVLGGLGLLSRPKGSKSKNRLAIDQRGADCAGKA